MLIKRVDYNHIHIEGYFALTQDSVTGYQGYKTISDLGYVSADNKHIGNSGVFEWVDSSSVLQATPAVSVMFETFAANTDNRIKITSESGNLPSSYTVTGTVSINNTFEIIP